MARKSSVISVLITGDNRELSRSLDDSSSRVADFGRKAGIALAAVGAAVGAAAFTIGRQAVSAASDLAESVNAVNVAFGDAADGILKLGESAATSMGVSQTEFNAAAVRFSAFAERVVGEGGDVAGFIDDISVRAADFASVFNIDVSEALQVFQSGLSGEAEPLKRFGINLLQAEVQAYALEAGIIAAGETMTEQEKVQARYGLLMQETAKTAGDFANTSDGLANSQRILRSRLDDTLAALGTAFLPLATSVVGVVADKLIPAFERFSDWFAANEGKITDFAERVLGGIETAVGFVGDKFAEWRPKIDGAIEFIRTKTAEFKTFWEENLQGPVDTALEKIKTFASDAKTSLQTFVSDLEPSLEGFLSFFRELDFDDPEQLGRDLGEALSNALKNALESIGTLGSNIKDAFSRLFAGVDWVGLGAQASTFLVQFGAGLVAGILSFDWLFPLLGGIADNWQVFAGAILTILFAPAKWAGAVGKALAKIPLVGRFLSWLVTSINKLGAGIRERVGLIFSSFSDGFVAAIRNGGPTLISRFTDFLLAFPRALVRMFDDLTLNVGTGFFNFGSSIGTAIRTQIGRIGSFLSTLMRPFTNFGRTLIDDLFNLGRNAMTAMANGIRRAGSAVWEAAKDVARRAWDAVSSLWKISSPSRVFMDIGHDAMEGLAIGIRDAERLVTAATGGVAMSALPSVNTGLGAPVGGSVVNITVTSADPEAVVEAIRRYTRSNGPLSQVVTV